MSDQPTERPWPAPSPDTGWWRDEAAAPPAGHLDVLDEASNDEPAQADEFPLWPDEHRAAAPLTVDEALADLAKSHTPEPDAQAPDPAAVDAPAPDPAAVDAPAPDAPAVQPRAADSPTDTHIIRRARQADQARMEQWPPPSMRLARWPSTTSAPPPPSRRLPVREPRHPAVGLSALLLLALLTSFFAWTSAEPLWLSVGHAEHGTAIVTRCEGSGVLRRCVASFTGRASSAESVPLVGAERAPGAVLDARMVPGGRLAYSGSVDGLRIRAWLGLGLVLLCGLVIAWVTGARRLPTRGARSGALALSLAAPLLLLVGMLAATF